MAESVEDRIIGAMWVERSSSVNRITQLTGFPRERVYSVMYRLVGRGWIAHPSTGVYQITDKGDARARVMMAQRSRPAFWTSVE
jgi:sugar-specific transcriptional regulator TrmB